MTKAEEDNTPPLSDWKMPPAPMCPLCNVPAIAVVQVVGDEAWAGFECPNVMEENGMHDEDKPLVDLLGDEACIPWPFDHPAQGPELEALGFTVQYV